MEDAFRRVVEQIFSNWTALRLAVEHLQGGPHSKNAAIYCIDYTTQFCLNKDNIDIPDIEDILEDLMDGQFNTVCEDGSIHEISVILNKFLVLVKEGNVNRYDREFSNLPKADEWLVKTRSIPVIPSSLTISTASSTEAPANTTSTEATVSGTATEEGNQGGSSNAPKPMEEDSEWTEVKSRKKK